MNAKTIEACARAAHEVNRAYCAALGDASQVPWEDAPEWQRESARNGVAGALAGNTPEQSHESWRAEKALAGWTYGQVKDAAAKTHPCMVPYAELPPEQQAKDSIFLAVVRIVDAMVYERDRALRLAEQYECDWHAAKYEFGTETAKLQDALRAARAEVERLRALLPASSEKTAPGLDDGRRAPMQGSRRRPSGTISWDEHLECWRAYAAKYGSAQSPETIASRHGFGWDEFVSLVGREPATWSER